MLIKALIPDDDAQAVAILEHAFRDDPLLNWLCSAPGFLPLLFGLGVPVFREQGIGYMAGDGKGVALWMEPGRQAQWSMGWSQLRKCIKVAGWRALYRFVAIGFKMERAHPVAPHYYLFAIGISPEAGGQGVGSALIGHVLTRCDREGLPAYLENSNLRNLPFYRKHGFRVLGEVRVTRSSPTVWLMWREPQVTARWLAVD